MAYIYCSFELSFERTSLLNGQKIGDRRCPLMGAFTVDYFAVEYHIIQYHTIEVTLPLPH
jgi:hypothetical protein